MKKILYTNCGPNVFMRGNGFKIFKCSVSASPKEREIADVYLGRYTLGELTERTPVRYRYTKNTELPGGAVYLKQQPSGTCYATGRSGNQLSQLLYDCGTESVIPVNVFLQEGVFYPIPAPQEIDGSREPKMLPDFPPLTQEKQSRSRLSEALKTPYYVRALDLLIAAACECLDTGKQLLLVAPAAKIPVFIQLLSLCLPRQYLKELTFNTFAERLEEETDRLLGIVSGTVNIQSYLREEKYIVFDLTDQSAVKTNYRGTSGGYVGVISKASAEVIDGVVDFIERSLQMKNEFAGEGAQPLRIGRCDYLNLITYIYLFDRFPLSAAEGEATKFIGRARETLSRCPNRLLVDVVCKKATAMLSAYGEGIFDLIAGEGLFPQEIKAEYGEEIGKIFENCYLEAYKRNSVSGVLSTLRKHDEQIDSAYCAAFRSGASAKEFGRLSMAELIDVFDDAVAIYKGRLVMSAGNADKVFAALKECLNGSDVKELLRGFRRPILVALSYRERAQSKRFFEFLTAYLKKDVAVYGFSDAVSAFGAFSASGAQELIFALADLFLSLVKENDASYKMSLDAVRELWTLLSAQGKTDRELGWFAEYVERNTIVTQKDLQGRERVVFHKKMSETFYAYLPQVRDRETLYRALTAKAEQAFTLDLGNLEFFLSQNNLYFERDAGARNDGLIRRCYRELYLRGAFSEVLRALKGYDERIDAAYGAAFQSGAGEKDFAGLSDGELCDVLDDTLSSDGRLLMSAELAERVFTALKKRLLAAGAEKKKLPHGFKSRVAALCENGERASGKAFSEFAAAYLEQYALGYGFKDAVVFLGELSQNGADRGICSLLTERILSLAKGDGNFGNMPLETVKTLWTLAAASGAQRDCFFRYIDANTVLKETDKRGKSRYFLNKPMLETFYGYLPQLKDKEPLYRVLAKNAANAFVYSTTFLKFFFLQNRQTFGKNAKERDDEIICGCIKRLADLYRKRGSDREYRKRIDEYAEYLVDAYGETDSALLLRQMEESDFPENIVAYTYRGMFEPLAKEWKKDYAKGIDSVYRQAGANAAIEFLDYLSDSVGTVPATVEWISSECYAATPRAEQLRILREAIFPDGGPLQQKRLAEIEKQGGKKGKKALAEYALLLLQELKEDVGLYASVRKFLIENGGLVDKNTMEYGEIACINALSEQDPYPKICAILKKQDTYSKKFVRLWAELTDGEDERIVSLFRLN